MTIVQASLADIEQIPALRGAMALEMGRDWDTLHPGWRQRFAEYWCDRQAAGNAQVFLAQTGNVSIGMAIASIDDDYRGATFGEFQGFVNCVFVEPSQRSHGIAHELMIAAMSWLRDNRCTIARLRSSEAARSMYAAMGFGTGREMELRLSKV